MNPKWQVGDCVQVNWHIEHWLDHPGFEDAPHPGDIGVIQYVDEQGDAWADFTGLGESEDTLQILNPAWADVWPGHFDPNEYAIAVGYHPG